MIRRSLAPCIARGSFVLFGALMAVGSCDAMAEQVRIDAAACDSPVHLVARDATLTSVLKRLADTLHFEIVYQARNDPLVNTDARMNANELVRELVRDMNFSLEQTVDAACAQGRRLVKVSVLPETGDKNGSVPVPGSAWQTAETARVARQALSDYLRSHGMDDVPQEAIAVR